MRIAICDDDACECRHISNLVRQLASTELGAGYESREFYTVETLLAEATESPFDLYLLDIVMPGMSGIELAACLHEHHRPNIIFLTSSKEYALDAFRVWAKGYLLKPIALDALRQAWQQLPLAALPSAPPEPEQEILIPLVRADRLISISQIVCVESRNHKAIYFLADGSTLCTRTLRQSFSSLIAPLLESAQFVLTHRAFVANLTFAKALSVKDHMLTMEGEICIPISKSQFLAVRSRFIDRINLTI